MRGYLSLLGISMMCAVGTPLSVSANDMMSDGFSSYGCAAKDLQGKELTPEAAQSFLERFNLPTEGRTTLPRYIENAFFQGYGTNLDIRLAEKRNVLFSGHEQAAYDLEKSASTQAAARFLMQATFGIKAQELKELADSIDALGDENRAFETWIDQQFVEPTTYYAKFNGGEVVLYGEGKNFDTVWLKNVVHARDQLRQRVAFTLNHIISYSFGAGKRQGLRATFYDVLVDNAFNNYRDVLEGVTTNAAMGGYLNLLANFAPSDPKKHVNENYAREFMQLFSLGEYRLDMRGNAQLDENGQFIPAYTEDDVKSVARALSGFRYGDRVYGGCNRHVPMIIDDNKHDATAKTLFPTMPWERQLAADQSASKDVQQVLDAVMDHPSMAPFVARQFIQHFVTSNPSGSYVKRVVRKFRTGDMKALMKAVLLDPEARNLRKASKNNYGRLRPPALRYTSILRALPHQVYSQNVRYQAHKKKDHVDNLAGHRPVKAGIIFSYYQPTDSQNGVIADAGMVSPEFGMLSDNKIDSINEAVSNVLSHSGFKGKVNSTGLVDIEKEANLLLSGTDEDLDELIDRIDLLFLGGSMDNQTRSLLIQALQAPLGEEEFYARKKEGLELEKAKASHRVLKVLFALFNSPQFAIQR